MENVIARFDVTLLEYVSPPIPKININIYEGGNVGDRMDFTLDFFLFNRRWAGKITERVEKVDEFWFVDEGDQMAFGLRYWRHVHHVKQAGEGSIITDKVDFRTANSFFDLFLFPAMYLQFLYRKPRYRRYFRCKSKPF